MEQHTFCEPSPSCSNEGRHPQSSIKGGGPSDGGSLMHERMVHLASIICKIRIPLESICSSENKHRFKISCLAKLSIHIWQRSGIKREVIKMVHSGTPN